MTTTGPDWDDRWLHRSTTDAIEERILRSIGELQETARHRPVFNADTYAVAVGRLRLALGKIADLRIEP